MLKKLDLVKIDECSVGDVCWIVLKQETQPLHSTINQIILSEDAIQVTTQLKGFRTVRCHHAFWNEADAKQFRKFNKDNL